MLEYLTDLSANQNDTVATFRSVPNAKELKLAEEMGGAAPFTERTLAAGSDIHFTVTGKLRCIGSRRLSESGGFTHVPCRTAREIKKGTQCFPCQRDDQSKLIHHTPREKASPELVTYLDVPHFLYVAAFADGVIKVGTSRAIRGVSRWVEQGAVAAIRLAEFEDGWAVRQAERAVSDQADLQQAVRAANKANAYTMPLTPAQIVEMLAAAASSAQQALAAEEISVIAPQEDVFSAVPGAEGGTLDFDFEVPDAVGWVNPVALTHLGEASHPVTGGLLDLASGTHDLHIVDTVGTAAFVQRREDLETLAADPTAVPLFVANWAALKARELKITQP